MVESVRWEFRGLEGFLASHRDSARSHSRDSYVGIHRITIILSFGSRLLVAKLEGSILSDDFEGRPRRDRAGGC